MTANATCCKYNAIIECVSSNTVLTGLLTV